MKIGSYTLHQVHAGTFGLDGGAMFGIIPKPLWEKSNPPDVQNRINLAMRCLLLKSDERVILVDNGAGNKYSDKLKDIYKFGDSMVSLTDELMKHNVKPEDVTDVILTHLHFDHAGGTTQIQSGDPVLTFPNAVHYVQRDHWEHAVKPTERDRGSFMKHDFELLASYTNLELLDGPVELFHGIDLLITNGHTVSQQLPKISDGTQTLFFCSDLVPTTAHIPFVYIMGYDIHPLVSLEDKKKYLRIANEEDWILMFEHDPEVAAAKIRRTDKGYLLGEEVKF
jgi:glyoxylase-like metal-dependent hydrolase (beta-lactamase superfamily II)